MTAIWMLAVLAAGLVLGAVIGFLYARARLAATLAALTGRVHAAEERARAAAERAELADGQLGQRFEALSARALDASARRFMEMAEGRLQAANVAAAGALEARHAAVEHLVGPLRETLSRVEAQLRESDADRHRSHAALAEQVSIARRSSEELRAQTQALVAALRRPEARGRWGEMQLRRVVELAGMSARCDFEEQVAVSTDDGGLRPDLVVRLAGGKNIVVDSKVSLAAYLEAAETTDGAVRGERLRAHARHLRHHVDQLAGKAYWAALSPAPEFVVLFIPGEAFLAPALDYDPGLLEHAMTQKVHIATPTTLVTMLRTAHYAWQQAALSENARAVFDLGRELYDRIGRFGPQLGRVGRGLGRAVAEYNQAVGVLESKVLVSARRLHQLGVVDAGMDSPCPVEETIRSLSAPELSAPELSAPELPGPELPGPGLPAAELPAAELPGPEPSGPELPGPELPAAEPSGPGLPAAELPAAELPGPEPSGPGPGADGPEAVPRPDAPDRGPAIPGPATPGPDAPMPATPGTAVPGPEPAVPFTAAEPGLPGPGLPAPSPAAQAGPGDGPAGTLRAVTDHNGTYG